MIDKIKSIFSQKDIFNINDKFDLFLELVENYLKNNHPYILFDLTIKDEYLSQENLKIKKTLIIEGIIKQFVNFIYIKNSQDSVKKELLWSGYGVGSSPNTKKPHDFLRRKELAFFRDNGICNRCGHQIDKLINAHTFFMQNIEEGGGYNLENIAILCFDCYKIENSQNKDMLDLTLNIRDSLYNFV